MSFGQEYEQYMIHKDSMHAVHEHFTYFPQSNKEPINFDSLYTHYLFVEDVCVNCEELSGVNEDKLVELSERLLLHYYMKEYIPILFCDLSQVSDKDWILFLPYPKTTRL